MPVDYWVHVLGDHADVSFSPLPPVPAKGGKYYVLVTTRAMFSILVLLYPAEQDLYWKSGWLSTVVLLLIQLKENFLIYQNDFVF